jgi:hypothetical protein
MDFQDLMHKHVQGYLFKAETVCQPESTKPDPRYPTENGIPFNPQFFQEELPVIRSLP